MDTLHLYNAALALSTVSLQSDCDGVCFTKPQNRYSHPICFFPLLHPSLGGVPQSYSITLLLTAITIPWGVQGVSPWLILSSSCFNLHNHNTDINTPFVPFPLSIPPWGVSPQSFYHYFLLTSYYYYYSLGGPGGLHLVISLYILHQFTKPQ